MKVSATLKESAFEWAEIPEDLPRENLVLITAKTPATMYHPTDPKYRIRRIPVSELETRAASLAQRPVGDTHAPDPIPNAFVVDAQYNPTTKAVEALVFLPDDYIMWIKEQEALGRKVEWSVEYTFRDVNFLENGVAEFTGVVFNRVDILRNLGDNKVAGDPYTNTTLVDDYLKQHRGLMEASIMSEEKCKCPKCGEEYTPTKKEEPMKEEATAEKCSKCGAEMKDGKCINEDCTTNEECSDAGMKKDKMTMKEAAELAKLQEDFNKVSTELNELKTKTIPELEGKVAKIPEIIKEKDDAVAIANRLQDQVKNHGSEKATAIAQAKKEGKEEVINKIKEVIPSNTCVSGNLQGAYRVLANDIKRVLYEVSEK